MDHDDDDDDELANSGSYRETTVDDVLSHVQLDTDTYCKISKRW